MQISDLSAALKYADHQVGTDRTDHLSVRGVKHCHRGSPKFRLVLTVAGRYGGETVKGQL